MKKIVSIISSTAILLIASTSASFALDVGGILGGLGGTTGELDDLIVKILNWLIGLGGLVCVVMIIVSGYTYMTAGGDEQKVSSAQKSLMNAIIGLVICFVAVMLVNFVLKTFLGQA